MRKGRDGGNGEKTGGKNGEKKKRRMKIVATTSLTAVDRPNADCWNAALLRQKTGGNSGHYIIASSRPLERHTLVPKSDITFCFACNQDLSSSLQNMPRTHFLWTPILDTITKHCKYFRILYVVLENHNIFSLQYSDSLGGGNFPRHLRPYTPMVMNCDNITHT